MPLKKYSKRGNTSSISQKYYGRGSRSRIDTEEQENRENQYLKTEESTHEEPNKNQRKNHILNEKENSVILERNTENSNFEENENPIGRKNSFKNSQVSSYSYLKNEDIHLESRN